MINKELAQKIVDEVIPLIHANVNIMNEKGIIIGSGNKSRIGQIHPIAKMVMESNDSNDSHNTIGILESEREIDGYLMQPGVNLPIYFNSKKIGVVGVTGNPKEIIEKVKLIQYTVELLVWKEYSTNKFTFKKMIISEYMSNVLSRKPINKNVYLDLSDLGINYNNFHYASIAVPETSEFDKIIDLIDHISRSFPECGACKYDDIIVIFSPKKIDFAKYFADSYNFHFFTGCKIEKSDELYKSYNVAKALSLYKKDDQISYYSENKLDLSIIIGYLDNEHLFTSDLKKYARLVDKAILLETYEAYIKYNGVIKDICDNLYIHRNTIIYRLAKIEEVTGYNLHKMEDAYRLYSLNVIYKILSKSQRKDLLK